MCKSTTNHVHLSSDFISFIVKLDIIYKYARYSWIQYQFYWIWIHTHQYAMLCFLTLRQWDISWKLFVRDVHNSSISVATAIINHIINHILYCSLYVSPNLFTNLDFQLEHFLKDYGYISIVISNNFNIDFHNCTLLKNPNYALIKSFPKSNYWTAGNKTFVDAIFTNQDTMDSGGYTSSVWTIMTITRKKHVIINWFAHKTEVLNGYLEPDRTEG